MSIYLIYNNINVLKHIKDNKMQNNLFTQGLDIHNHDQVLDLVSQDWRVLEHAGGGAKK